MLRSLKESILFLWHSCICQEWINEYQFNTVAPDDDYGLTPEMMAELDQQDQR